METNIPLTQAIQNASAPTTPIQPAVPAVPVIEKRQKTGEKLKKRKIGNDAYNIDTQNVKASLTFPDPSSHKKSVLKIEVPGVCSVSLNGQAAKSLRGMLNRAYA